MYRRKGSCGNSLKAGRQQLLFPKVPNLPCPQAEKRRCPPRIPPPRWGGRLPPPNRWAVTRPVIACWFSCSGGTDCGRSNWSAGPVTGTPPLYVKRRKRTPFQPANRRAGTAAAARPQARIRRSALDFHERWAGPLNDDTVRKIVKRGRSRVWFSYPHHAHMPAATPLPPKARTPSGLPRTQNIQYTVL